MGGQAGWGRGADCSRGGGEMSVGEWDIWCRNRVEIIKNALQTMASQRRVSLALPASAPRVPWAFRDDTGLAGPSSAPPPAPPEKKPRKKWSPEETQMLVDGCNRVRLFPRVHRPRSPFSLARRRQLEDHPQRPHPHFRQPLPRRSQRQVCLVSFFSDIYPHT